MEKTPEIESVREDSVDNRYQELIKYPVIQERMQEIFLADYRQAEQDVSRVLKGDHSPEIGERWSDLHNIIYSEKRCQEAFDVFKLKGKEISEINLEFNAILKRFHTHIFEYRDEDENDHLFIEMNCDQCGCKKFFEVNNKGGTFRLPFVKNGSIGGFVEGLTNQLRNKGLNCSYCWAREDREREKRKKFGGG